MQVFTVSGRCLPRGKMFAIEWLVLLATGASVTVGGTRGRSFRPVSVYPSSKGYAYGVLGGVALVVPCPEVETSRSFRRAPSYTVLGWRTAYRSVSTVGSTAAGTVGAGCATSIASVTRSAWVGGDVEGATAVVRKVRGGGLASSIAAVGPLYAADVATVVAPIFVFRGLFLGNEVGVVRTDRSTVTRWDLKVSNVG